MKTAHTPGPWTWEHTSASGKGEYCLEIFPPVNPNYRGTVAHLQSCEHIEGITQAECEANARLIAAAPDLLAEAEREYAELSNVHNSWPGRDTPSGQMKLGRLRDLIAKATGRSDQDVQDDYGNRGTP